MLDSLIARGGPAYSPHDRVGALLVYVQTSMGFVGIGSQGNRDVWLRWSAGTLAHLRALDEHPTLLAASLAGSRTDASGLPAHEVAFEGVSFRYPGLPSRDSLTFPLRQRLLQALDDLDRPWTAGPYSDAARLLLRGRTGAIRHMFDRCEELADVVRGSDVPWVITHGQLHEANIVLDADDDLYFVDLETLNVAPRERDTIWGGLVLPMTDDDWVAYTSAAGQTAEIDPVAVDFYSHREFLWGISAKTELFRSAHVDDADIRREWGHFQKAIDLRLPR